ncbi:hypothetical protein V6Z93_006145 [Aspergillus fumigatus]
MNIAKLVQDGGESSAKLQSLQQPGTSPGNRYPLAKAYGLQIYATKSVPKIPIPLLRRATSSSRRRTLQACGPCRERKIKCSGETPECQRCGSAKAHCWYPATTKQQKEKRLKLLQSKLRSYETLLRYLSLKLDAADSDKIKSALSDPEGNWESALDSTVIR